jgi:hypothetical protein
MTRRSWPYQCVGRGRDLLGDDLRVYTRHYVDSRCRSCAALAAKEWRRTHPEETRANSRQSHERRRERERAAKAVS